MQSWGESQKSFNYEDFAVLQKVYPRWRDENCKIVFN